MADGPSRGPRPRSASDPGLIRTMKRRSRKQGRQCRGGSGQDQGTRPAWPRSSSSSIVDRCALSSIRAARSDMPNRHRRGTRGPDFLDVLAIDRVRPRDGSTRANPPSRCDGRRARNRRLSPKIMLFLPVWNDLRPSRGDVTRQGPLSPHSIGTLACRRFSPKPPHPSSRHSKSEPPAR